MCVECRHDIHASERSADRQPCLGRHLGDRRRRLSRRRSRTGHRTFTLTDASPPIVNVHDFALFPPLEQAPDQIASRPFVTLSVIDVPVVNDPDPELPTATLMPAGLDVTRSPLRPVALTVSVTV